MTKTSRSRDLTGLPASEQLLTDEPTADLRISRTVGRDVPTPMRPARMSARRYRELFDSTPHMVEVAAIEVDGKTIEHGVRARVAGAVSAAVFAHAASFATRYVTIRPLTEVA